MTAPPRQLPYVLAATHHGPMIANRNDWHQQGSNVYGVGFQLLENGAFDPPEIELAKHLLDARRAAHGDGVFAIDGGANVGVHTVEWARHMHGWGRVLAFEAQEYVFYALAGNIALNNCFNASARWMALGETPGTLMAPKPDYLSPGSFGSLELRARPGQTEFIGQKISYDAKDCVATPMQCIDALDLPRLDFIKLDIEGMEVEVLRGARKTLERHRPIMMIEFIKSDQWALDEFIKSLGYSVRQSGLNVVATHVDDPAQAHVHLEEARKAGPA